MISSFKCKLTEELFNDEPVKEFQAFRNPARRKLAMLNAATTLTDLKAPPNNKLEKLKDDRLGQHSIRITRVVRLCFVWGDDNNSHEVEVVPNYH